jgi:hypothetical protein
MYLLDRGELSQQGRALALALSSPTFTVHVDMLCVRRRRDESRVFFHGLLAGGVSIGYLVILHHVLFHKNEHKYYTSDSFIIATATTSSKTFYAK